MFLRARHTPTDVAGVLRESRRCGRTADIEPQGAVFRAAVARFMTVTTYVNESLNREIAQQYSSVALADIYSVIAYYFRHQSEVRVYLAARQRHAAQVREGMNGASIQHASAIVS